MAAALPYCDAFVSGHSYAALADLAAAVSAPTRSRGADSLATVVGRSATPTRVP